MLNSLPHKSKTKKTSQKDTSKGTSTMSLQHCNSGKSNAKMTGEAPEVRSDKRKPDMNIN